MTDNRHDYYNPSHSLHDDCKRYRYYHVTLTTTDGNYFDGIIEDVGSDNVTVLVGEDVMEREGEIEEYDRQFGYGFPGRRFRRFRRRRFPLASLAALALLPYIVPPPYPYYPYPYPYYYPYY